jgi:hypothetical protein
LCLFDGDWRGRVRVVAVRAGGGFLDKLVVALSDASSGTLVADDELGRIDRSGQTTSPSPVRQAAAETGPTPPPDAVGGFIAELVGDGGWPM